MPMISDPSKPVNRIDEAAGAFLRETRDIVENLRHVVETFDRAEPSVAGVVAAWRDPSIQDMISGREIRIDASDALAAMREIIPFL